jgi:putative spermidine/putrescine transport system substrate-binding protein
MSLRANFGKLATAAVMAVTLSAGVAEARDFTIASWGGEYQKGQRDIFFAPYAKAKGMDFLEDTYLGGWAQFQAMQETKNIPWDVVQVETAEMARGCEEGLFLELDWSKIGPKSNYVPGAATECGVGVVIVSVVVAFNDDLIGADKPKTLEDFFNVKKWPGKRGLRDDPKHKLEFALMADGVAVGDVYNVLSTPAGVDRAFKKLDEVKPFLQFWKAGAQAPEWLAAGDVVMSTAYNGRVSSAQKSGRNLKMVWDRNTVYLDSWVILKDSPHVDAAYGYMKFYSDAKLQAEYSMNVLPYGPSVKDATQHIPAKVMATLPAGKNIDGAFVTGSPEGIAFWVDNLDALTERWNAWKGQ